MHAPGFLGYRQDYYLWATTPGPWGTGTPLGEVGDQPSEPGCARQLPCGDGKCSLCHSVHRAAGGGSEAAADGRHDCACCRAAAAPP